MNVYNYADILVEGAFRATEYGLAHVNVFSRYCLTFSANGCVFSLNEQQKVYFVKDAYMFTFDLKSGYVMFKKLAGMFYRV